MHQQMSPRATLRRVGWITTASAILLGAAGFLIAFWIGWTLTSSSSIAGAHSGQLINARVAQEVDNHGVSARIPSADPDVTWALGDFSYMRVIAQQSTPHRFGEIGWYRGSYLTRNAVKVVAVAKGSNGSSTRWVGPTISTSSTYTYKVVNDELCNGGATTLDNAWDFCYGTTKLVTHDIGIETAPRFISGGEVGTVSPRSPHGIEMGPSSITNNKYKTTSGNWLSTTSVICADADPETPSNGVCESWTDDDYQVTGVNPPDSTWRVEGP